VTCRPFISYAKEDHETAARLYHDLVDLGAEPWLDVYNLRGGAEWKPAIRKALRESSHVLTLISKSSVGKTGFVQNEVREALELLESFPPDKVFIVPIRLDSSRPRHERLNELQWIDLIENYDEGLGSLARTLELPGRLHRRQIWLSWLPTILLCVLAVVTITMNVRIPGLQTYLGGPQMLPADRVLLPDGQRGTDSAVPITIPSEGDNLLLFPALPKGPTYPRYRLRMIDLNTTPPNIVWERADLRFRPDSTLAISIPTSYFTTGRYRLTVDGVDKRLTRLLASYSISARRADLPAANHVVE
jgi:hypothetical protein